MASSYAHDDGFREIQLNGKQLFFLFMATTVVSVVIFLCGVLVGRGVRAERTAIADATVEQAPTSDIAPVAAPVQSVASDPIAATPPPQPKADDEIRPAQVEITAVPVPKADPIKPISAAAASMAAASPVKAEASPAPKPEPPPVKPKEGVRAGAAPVSAGPGAEPGFVVQVAAVKTRSEADGLVKKVTANGFQVFVSQSPTGGMFRVRVGPYKGRREAETAADKLKRQLGAKDIWVTAL